MRELDLPDLLSKAVSAVGAEQVASALHGLAQSGGSTDTLTLIANAGVHTIPPQFLRGQVYEVSRGSWAARDSSELQAELQQLLTRLARVLRSRAWRRVYLIPTGHPILTAQVKLLVYRLLRISTTDLYHRGGDYLEVFLDHRAIALAVDDSNDQDSEC